MNNMKKNLQIKGININKENIIKDKKEEKEEKLEIENEIKDNFEIDKEDPEILKINDEYQLIENEILGGGAFGVVRRRCLWSSI